jgi:CTP:phosphocholine cytidylyltransferase-like protein
MKPINKIKLDFVESLISRGILYWKDPETQKLIKVVKIEKKPFTVILENMNQLNSFANFYIKGSD